MTSGKIEVNVGGLAFSAEGEQEWLAEQLDKILKAAPDVVAAQSTKEKSDARTVTHDATKPAGTFTDTLASYIKAHKGDDNQVQRFLVTADWLRRRGEKTLTTRAVSTALKAHHQRKLTNPADALNQNVGKGCCEKADGGFFITPDGLKVLGHE
jgi:hypothetical protein